MILNLRPPIGGTQQRGLVVEHDVDGNGRERLAHAAFVHKALHKAAVAQLGENLGRDAAADENPPRRHQIQRQVPRFATVEEREEVEGCYGQRGVAFEAGASDGVGAVGQGGLGGQRSVGAGGMSFAQKVVDRGQASGP